MSQEPKVTRFGADPTVDQELATKAYVDAGGGGATPHATTGTGHLTSGSNNLLFLPWAGGNGGLGASEANISLTVPFGFTALLTELTCTTNSKNDETLYFLRDDGVSINTLTVPSSTTGKFASGVLALAVASGSDVAIGVDRTASSSGSLDCIRYNTVYEST